MNTFIACVEDTLKQGEKLTIPGFGTFLVVERKARTGRNPATGKKMKIPAKKVPKFAPGKGLNEVACLLQAGRLDRERSVSEEFWGTLIFLGDRVQLLEGEMKRFRMSEIGETEGIHFLGDFTEGEQITRGGLHFFKPGEVPHPDYHVHENEEAFLILQGKARLPIDGQTYDLEMGDVVIVEPGEDHHLTGDEEDPAVVLWFEVE